VFAADLARLPPHPVTEFTTAVNPFVLRRRYGSKIFRSIILLITVDMVYLPSRRYGAV
jgi:hypothetical protein